MHSKPHYVGGGHDYQLIGYCEIDKYAANAYSQIHGVSENYNLVDVTKVNTVLMDDVDLITYGFPCQDISAAGKQRGFEDKDGNRTRSGLFFEALRTIEETRPLYAIAENVKALTSKKFEKEFKTVLDSLDGAGYNNYYKVLNAKDYGIPQNRERVFIISIRKDIDTGAFTFPEKQEMKKSVKDILEPVIDDKYTVSDSLWEGHQRRKKEHKEKGNGFGYSLFNKNSKYTNTLSARYYKDGSEILIEQPSKNPRKLTPLECFRLMGFSDEEFNRIKGVSNTQLYKMAGNSIVVNVLEGIFNNLLKG